MRIVAVSIILPVLFGCIGAMFWYQEAQYLLPTTVPANYVSVVARQVVNFDSSVLTTTLTKPTLFHFFSPDCPCSRFNLKHFVSLKKKYGNTIKFYAVVSKKDEVQSAKKMLDADIEILVDQDKRLAKACGVYSTPQAAIVATDSTLYFRGNYNRARYCTDKNSNYVQMALDSLTANRKPPQFNEFATTSYGCGLPQSNNPPAL